MSIGYACLTVGVSECSLRTCTMKNASEQRLMELIEHNLDVLERVIEYNIENNIHLFRISSDIIPFGSSPVNELAWDKIFAVRLAAIGTKALNAGMRLSMHPGQYTVINSPDNGVVERAVKDLQYHTLFLDSLGLNREHKVVLHIGGAYGDKISAIERFKENYRKLDDSIKRRLIIENDDKIYTIDEVYTIGKELEIPVVFDNLHHQVNHNEANEDAMVWIERCRTTWKPGDGHQKMHYSVQAKDKRPGSHSQTVYAEPFAEFYRQLDRLDIDIMLEVKDKNLSAVKCNYAIKTAGRIVHLEREWSRYKYSVLEHDAAVYQSIRELLKEKKNYPVIPFYTMIEAALERETETASAVNALQHVWGYFKDMASEKEKERFFTLLDQYQQEDKSLKLLKSNLKRLAQKYGENYLLDSYYFEL